MTDTEQLTNSLRRYTVERIIDEYEKERAVINDRLSAAYTASMPMTLANVLEGAAKKAIDDLNERFMNRLANFLLTGSDR